VTVSQYSVLVGGHNVRQRQSQPTPDAEHLFAGGGSIGGVSLVLQPSLLDLEPAPHASAGGCWLRPLAGAVGRTDVGRGAWVDVRRSWLAGAGQLCERLLTSVPWRAERRPMYDRVVDVPRLASFYGEDEPLPDPLLEEARRALDSYYAAELGERFRTAGLCCYRDGRDSVAWHGDTIGRGAREDTMVAIVSLGAARRLLLRERGGGASLRFELGSGDLLVMGGACQRTHEHAVPKTARPVGTRISVQFRPSGVR
jgi:alkylated DNA repair dioxygenase AlkB